MPKFTVTFKRYGHLTSAHLRSRELATWARPHITVGQLFALAIAHHRFGNTQFAADSLGELLGLSNPTIRARLRRLAKLGLIKRHSLSRPIFSTQHPECAAALWSLTDAARQLLDKLEVRVEETT